MGMTRKMRMMMKMAMRMTKRRKMKIIKLMNQCISVLFLYIFSDFFVFENICLQQIHFDRLLFVVLHCFLCVSKSKKCSLFFSLTPSIAFLLLLYIVFSFTSI